MSEIKIEKYNYQPGFPNEIWIIDKDKQEEFQITLKQGSDDIEIDFFWDYGWGGRGSDRMIISAKLLKELMNELGI